VSVRRLSRRGALALVAAAFLVVASQAGAASFQRTYKETFGSAAQPKTSRGGLLAVEESTGKVLFGEGRFIQEPATLGSYEPDGTPAEFTALGDNVLDGQAGPGGLPCAQEAASCDQTPQNRIELTAETAQIAIDESNGPASGDIYITQNWENLVDIFSGEGKYLGQLTGAGFEKYEEVGSPCGVVVDKSGAVYVSTTGEIIKYMPTSNPPSDFDLVWRDKLPSFEGPCQMALGAGPTAGSLFVTNRGGNSGNAEGGPKLARVSLETGQTTILSRKLYGLVAVDPHNGNVFVKNPAANNELDEYAPGSETLGPVLSRLYMNGAELTGEPEDNFAGFSDVVGDGKGNLYVAWSQYGSLQSPISIFGEPHVVPTPIATAPSNVTGTRATLNGTVEPENLTIEACHFEYAVAGEFAQWEPPVPCGSLPPGDNGTHAVSAPATGLTPNGTEYEVRLVVKSPAGTEISEPVRFTTAFTIQTGKASDIEPSSATLNGTVLPEGETFSACVFEYGIASAIGFEHTTPCLPGAEEIPASFSPQLVRAPVSGLQPGTIYRYRLVTTNAGLGTQEGEEIYFSTHGSPQITQVQAFDATETTVGLEGRINPSGFGTTYRFEWGPTTAYGHSVPAEFAPYVGEGESPVQVIAQISGLSAATTYHYRLVAKSEAGPAASIDHTFETVNTCGLPEGRCFELVSRSEAGPIAIPGEYYGSAELHYQVAPGGGAVVYPVEAGYPDASRGAEVLYRGVHGSDGWLSTQIGIPLTAYNEHHEVGSESGFVRWLSDNLSCGFAESTQRLTEDPTMRQVVEEGGSNLFRINPPGDPAGPYTAMTTIAPNKTPQGLEAAYLYTFQGGSQDCGKFVFTTTLRYPGVPTGPGRFITYEWDHGTLRSLGVVPGPGGEEVPVEGPVVGRDRDFQNAVSEDGSRVFFTAYRQTSPDEAEIGHLGLFVRENGSVTHDVSLSETETPDTEAEYQWATPDGSRVFFTATAGLTEPSNSEGTDLYEYNLEAHKLVDRSVTPAKGGARVAKFVAGATDGSRVFFTSRNQLVPGSGRTLAQNEKANTYSIYGEDESGQITYVGAIGGGLEEVNLTTLSEEPEWTSQASADGRYLLFQSKLNLTGYESGEKNEAYLYDASEGSHGTICISCRRDGSPSVQVYNYSVLPRGQGLGNERRQPQFLIDPGGVPRIFFSSPDALAPNAVEGQNNIYEWVNDQVFRLAGAPAGTQVPAFGGYYSTFAGASASGGDVYLSSPENLSWEDGDQRISMFDARIGAGSPPPAPPAEPCAASREGPNSCQGTLQGATASPNVATTTDRGEQNVEAKKKAPAKKKPKKKKKHKGKKHKKKKGKKGKGKAKKGKQKAKRDAKSNRRAGR
jgi:hypothetical protein